MCGILGYYKMLKKKYTRIINFCSAVLLISILMLFIMETFTEKTMSLAPTMTPYKTNKLLVRDEVPTTHSDPNIAKSEWPTAVISRVATSKQLTNDDLGMAQSNNTISTSDIISEDELKQQLLSLWASCECCYPKDILTKHIPFQPDVTDDFPSLEGSKPRIPPIIHQTFLDENIPHIYWDNIKSIITHNPHWKYYFWTDASARKLIAERHPHLLATFDGYEVGIKRGDALRYVILYEFGGVYLDLDYEALRPFDRVTTKYASIIAPNVFEHSAILYDSEYIIMNSIMFSRPKHPFFKTLIEELPKTAKKTLRKATGPLLVTRMFDVYNNITAKDKYKVKTDCRSNSPYFYKGLLPEDHEDAVYIPHTQYFGDIIDFENGYGKKFQGICKRAGTLTDLREKGCAEMSRRGMIRKDTRFTFTKHKWSHIYMKEKAQFQYKNIKAIVKNVEIY